jgi:hypothetical protein
VNARREPRRVCSTPSRSIAARKRSPIACSAFDCNAPSFQSKRDQAHFRSKPRSFFFQRLRRERDQRLFHPRRDHAGGRLRLERSPPAANEIAQRASFPREDLQRRSSGIDPRLLEEVACTRGQRQVTISGIRDRT